ncbi:hypothetical protein ACFSMW_14795 [Virgibacillus halophilus]|uniref:Tetratricopeptide repeat-containing protein n=1 Tax=Tigheibacillus halophilus TaxID=361280 RepID=A0ABU5CBU3_9BACI|nr:hypothetical protein [Virgibacillus halophilus]
MFLASDQEKADREMDCYGYCLKIAIEHYMRGDFAKAAAYHENIIRSLRELENMVRWKQMHVEAMELLNQMEIKQQQSLAERLEMGM